MSVSTTVVTAEGFQPGAPGADTSCGRDLQCVRRSEARQKSAFGISHLKCLIEAGLLIATPRSGWTYYRRNDPVIEAVAAAVART